MNRQPLCWATGSSIVTVVPLTSEPFCERIDTCPPCSSTIVLQIASPSPTPGGSGVAEYAFPLFLGDFIPDGLETALGLLWRLLSYYPYLFIGFIILPFWIRRVYVKSKRV